MNSRELPKDVVERVERRWMQKLQQQLWHGRAHVPTRTP